MNSLKPGTLTFENDEGVFVATGALVRGFEGAGSTMASIGFVYDTAKFIPKEPPVGSAVKCKDVVFVRSESGGWENIQGDLYVWDTMLELGAEIIYRKAHS